MLVRIFKVLFVPYTVGLLYFMFIGFGREVMDDHIVRLSPLISMYSFAEHNLLYKQYWVFVVNLLGNILVFIPFGFLGWLFPKLVQLKPLMLHFWAGIFIIEGLQYFTRRGVFEIDDIILNSLGVLVGFYFKCYLEKEWKRLL